MIGETIKHALGLLSPAAMVFAFLAVTFSAYLRGVTGFGFGIAAVPLLSILLPPALAVPLVLMLQLFVSLGSLPSCVPIAHWRSIGVLSVGAVIGTPLGMAALALLPADAMRLAIAVLVCVAVFLLWSGSAWARMPGRLATMAIGVVSGLCNGTAAMPGPPVIIYYLSSPVEAAPARASMIIFFVFSAAAATVAAVHAHLIKAPDVVFTVLLLPALAIGSTIGEWQFNRMGAKSYRTLALISLLAIGVLVAVRAVPGVLQML